MSEEFDHRIARFDGIIQRSESVLKDRPDQAALRLNLGTARSLRDLLRRRQLMAEEGVLLSSGVTPYHAKFFAAELLRRTPDGEDRFASTLMDAKVDLNPHQVDAALFAFRSPLSQGALLADEVGLGKTIEAGLVLAQFWAERRRRILIIVPASLRMQWRQELEDKFHLRSLILETKSFNTDVKAGIPNPFDRPQDDPRIVIVSYNFARNKSAQVAAVPWDLVIMDEAHRMRNVYKKGNRIARELRDCLKNRRKILLTATPLQNTLMELYGLVSFIDDYLFGDPKSFASQFTNGDSNFTELKARLAPVCKRTLRKDVQEYVQFTKRVSLTIKFRPTDEEHQVYEMISSYLQRASLQALPSSQRSLMTLVLRKLLASSTFAIAGALESLGRKLRERLIENADAAKKAEELREELAGDFEEYDDIQEEWDDEGVPSEFLSPDDITAIEDEIAELDAFRTRATAIVENAKGQTVLTALEKGFSEAARNGAAQKAIIFTESRRTQEYLVRILEKTPYADGIVLFNGSNSDARSQKIYRDWLKLHANSDRVTGSRTADSRAALVDYFRDRGQIMIATEAAAEGINLQFCSLLINYDLPWNPQRIEQRIGRCHRYGQKHDVVVVNFLNERNEADQRVLQLLEEKFQLFSGIFGASDEVLGAIENGVDFERRILDIYQRCRTREEIQTQFNFLQDDLREKIQSTKNEAHQRLMDNFDTTVVERLRSLKHEGQAAVHRHERWLWDVTRHVLGNRAAFMPDRFAFILHESPLPDQVPTGYYSLARHGSSGHTYRFGGEFAQHVLQQVTQQQLPPASLVFDSASPGVRITPLRERRGSSGTLLLSRVSMDYSDKTGHDEVILSAVCDSGEVLDDEMARDLFRLPAKVEPQVNTPDIAPLAAHRDERANDIFSKADQRNAELFEQETTKLDGWATDMKKSLEAELKQLDQEIADAKRQGKTAPSLAEKIEWQRKQKAFEQRRKERRRQLYDEQDKVDDRRGKLINEAEEKLRQTRSVEELFVIRWKIA